MFLLIFLMPVFVFKKKTKGRIRIRNTNVYCILYNMPYSLWIANVSQGFSNRGGNIIHPLPPVKEAQHLLFRFPNRTVILLLGILSCILRMYCEYRLLKIITV